MTAPKRIQLRRTKGWRKPDGAIVVSRPNIWGNPFKVGDRLAWPYNVHGDTVRDRAHAVAIFRDHARISAGFDLLVRHELAGHDLACWCPPDQPCHADVLLEIANPKADN